MAKTIRSSQTESTEPPPFSKYEARRAILERHDFGGQKVSGSTCKLVALTLCHYVNGITGETWVSVARLARELGKARSTIQSALRALEACGVIRRSDAGIGGRMAATYALRVGWRLRVECAPSDLEIVAAESAAQTIVARAERRESPCSLESRPPDSGVYERERPAGAPPPEASSPPGTEPSAVARLGGAGAPRSHEPGDGGPDVESADPGLAVALAIAAVRDAYDRALLKRWGVRRYTDAPQAWTIAVDVAHTVAQQGGVRFTTAAEAVWCSYFDQTGHRDGLLLEHKHPPEWFARYATICEGAALASLRARSQAIACDLSLERSKAEGRARREALLRASGIVA